MPEFQFQEIFELGPDATEYRSLGSEGVATAKLGSREILTVAPELLRRLAAEAMRDVSHLFRTGHLAQLRKILDDPEASANDRFVALEMLKNANVSAGMILPSCQDTGTAIVIGKKGENVFTGADDEEWLAHGVYDTYTGTNLRYSQMAPLSMYEEKNTGSNLPAQIEIYSTPGDAYEFLFVTKGGGSANKSFLYQETRAILNPESLLRFLGREAEDARHGRLSALPPGDRHRRHVGGVHAEDREARELPRTSTTLPDAPATRSGRAFRDLELEEQVLEAHPARRASARSSAASTSATTCA